MKTFGSDLANTDKQDSSHNRSVLIKSESNSSNNQSKCWTKCGGLKFLDDNDRANNCHMYNSYSPKNESWFNTWPESCEKVKPTNLNCHKTTRKSLNTRDDSNCDNAKEKEVNKEETHSENISFDGLRLKLDKIGLESNNVLINCKELIKNDSPAITAPKLAHRRKETGSFSSTASTLSYLSDRSPSGTLLNTNRSGEPLNVEEVVCKSTKGISKFFSRNFWKSSSNRSTWNLFSKQNERSSASNSPVHVVASSSALIQHERPLNLPAKTWEEKQRHKDEYNAILAAAKKKEAQNSLVKQKLQNIQLQVEEQQADAAKHFTVKVLPNWERMQDNKKTQELWWQGLPSNVRGKVWRLAIGNELNLTPQLYEICLNRAKNRLNLSENDRPDSIVSLENSVDAIHLDISRTFPQLGMFQKGGPFSEGLSSLLAAYVCYRPDVGYVQGMSYIAAILILNMDQFDAFVCFSNLLNQPLHVAAFTLDQDRMRAYYAAYDQVLSKNLPKLHAHFKSAGLTPDLYLLDWIYTIFAKAMPLDVACRVWDLILRDGYEFIFRTALGILHLNQNTLMEMDFLHGAQFLTKLPDDMSSNQLFKSVLAVSTTIGKVTFSQIVEKCWDSSF